MANFNSAIPVFFQDLEGYINPLQTKNGSESIFGITRSEYPDWSGWAIIENTFQVFGKSFNPAFTGYFPVLNSVTAIQAIESNQDLKNKATNEVYKPGVWDYLWGDKMSSQAIANALMYSAVFSGVEPTIKNLQRTLNNLFNSGLQVDGIMGNKTLTALNNNFSKNESGIVKAIETNNPSVVGSYTSPTTNTSKPTTTIPTPSVTPNITTPTVKPTKMGLNILLFGGLAIGGLIYYFKKKK